MARFDAAEQHLQGFRGITALFPLSNVVLFPHAVLPLHIFEPRYRKMTADMLADQRFLSMALYQPRPEGLVLPEPPAIHPVVGVGKIIADDRLPDGRYYLALQGLARARVLEELPTGLPYRTGRLELLHEECALSPGEQVRQAQELSLLFTKAFPQADLRKLLDEAVASSRPLSVVTDLLGATIPFAVTISQMLMETLDPAKRADVLFGVLHNLLEIGPAATTVQRDRLRDFPPPFSSN